MVSRRDGQSTTMAADSEAIDVITERGPDEHTRAPPATREEPIAHDFVQKRIPTLAVHSFSRVAKGSPLALTPVPYLTGEKNSQDPTPRCALSLRERCVLCCHLVDYLNILHGK